MHRVNQKESSYILINSKCSSKSYHSSTFNYRKLYHIRKPLSGLPPSSASIYCGHPFAVITTFHLSRPDPAATNSERYRQPLTEHNYSTGTMANQLIRVFLKFNFMALQHQDKQSLMLLWVNELYPLCLQLLNSLVQVIECCTFNLSQGPSFAVGCSSHFKSGACFSSHQFEARKFSGC